MKSFVQFMVMLGMVLATSAIAVAQPSEPTDESTSLTRFIEAKYGIEFNGRQISDASQALLISGAEIGKQRLYSTRIPARDAHLDRMQKFYESVCALYSTFKEDNIMAECLRALLGGYNEEAERWIRDAGGRIPADPVDYFTYYNWPALPSNPTTGSGLVIGIPPFPGSGTPSVSGAGTLPVPGAPGSPQPTSPLDMQSGSLVGSLYGVPVCTWEVQIIGTGETSEPDRNLFSDQYNIVSVPADEVERFHVQLYHRGLKRKARLSGPDALRVLLAKKYFRFSAPDISFVSTSAYLNFVNYGQEEPASMPSCNGSDPDPIAPGQAGTGVLYAKVTSAALVNNWNSYGRYGVKWRIDNPTGVEIRFTKNKVTTWELKKDATGGTVGGEYVTRKERSFTVPAGGRDTSAEFYVPCVSGVCQGGPVGNTKDRTPTEIHTD